MLRLRLSFVVVLLSVLGLNPLGLPLVGQAAAPRPPAMLGYPASIASTGDSITRGFNSQNAGDNPANSWATGDNAAINSHYLRIKTASPAIGPNFYNDAQSSQVMAGLNAQMATVNGQAVDYVTVLMGANDVCQSSEAAMTSVVDFKSQFQTALNTLASGSPNARVFVLSIPDIYNLWSVLHTNSNAAGVWNNSGLCQAMLANPTSTAQADSDRRARVRQREIDFNGALSDVCAQFVHCRFDNNLTFNNAYTPDDVSTLDYFHPSLAGQTKLAANTWPATFDFNDNTPPVSRLALSPNYQSGSLSLTLTATDNVGVAGQEYELDGASSWTKYAGPVGLSGSNLSLTYRAVDVNGNNELPHTLWLVGNNGQSGATGQTLATALTNATAGDTVSFALTGPPTVQLNGPLTLKRGVRLDSGSCPGVTLSYLGSPPAALQLGGGNNLFGLQLRGLSLSSPDGSTGNHLSCLRVNRTSY